ncbi:MAG: ParB N-terminal domain-containing protein [Nitrososphaerota archaeon]|nr:ParB N-terminal domain-containing protein [Nitrososphaerota archaeon]
MNSGRVVSHAGFRLELSILRLEELLPHEETIPESVLKLKQNLIEDGVQRDPIIIDSRTLTILDGMHRHRALTELSAKLGVVCRVDYSDSRVKVKRWLRSAKFDDKRVSELSKTTGLRISMSRDEAIRLVDSRASVAALVRGRKALASLTAGGPFDSFSVVRSFDEYCKRSNIPVSIQTDDEGFPPDESHATLYVPLPDKDDVVKAATLKRLFPPKSTRHLIPARPLGLGIPLDSLRNQSLMAQEQANAELDRIIGNSKPTRLGPGSTYLGRKYEETIYVYGA